MIELIKQSIPTHTSGESFSIEVPISQSRGEITGIGIYILPISGITNDKIFATASICDESGDVVMPELLIQMSNGMIFNKIIQPVNYKKVNSLLKITINETATIQQSISYTANIYLTRQGGELC